MRRNRYPADQVLRDSEVSEAQAQLFVALERSKGSYDVFVPPELGPETPSTEPLLTEHRTPEPR